MSESQTSRAASRGATLVVLRHGESAWNRSKRLTGWADVPLTERGRRQAREAGARMRAQGLAFDVCFSSLLVRATETRDLALAELGGAVPVRASWRLNERHYGALQGLYPWQAVWRHGLGPVARCARDFAAPPPLLESPHDLPPAAVGAIDEAAEWQAAMRGESLADALHRLLPLWEGEIAPALRAGRRVLVVAHNNLLRALVRHIESPSGAAAGGARLRTAQPWVIELDSTLRLRQRYAL